MMDRTPMFPDMPYDKVILLCEAVFDITDHVVTAIHRHIMSIPEDSRQLFDAVFDCAEKFEADYTRRMDDWARGNSEDEPDYLWDLHQFAERYFADHA